MSFESSEIEETKIFNKSSVDYHLVLAEKGEIPLESKGLKRQMNIECLNVFLSTFVFPGLAYWSSNQQTEEQEQQYQSSDEPFYCPKQSVLQLCMILGIEACFVYSRYNIHASARDQLGDKKRVKEKD